MKLLFLKKFLILNSYASLSLLALGKLTGMLAW
ncbi:hypothetical protein X474_15130 [Dethiosulfatarculus sandiegensis]|uniref:Uncharacterized protein n=1 Tax=Dethiosulfatarculus sandiegensis TaxID=1429043 RepID=A0A0D2JUT6_9BACT|nr:hypothetical protein X474_15130 [Dethiosulfatarculus sandiegensis]